MKLPAILLLAGLITHGTRANHKSPNNTFYYFCVSNSMQPYLVKNKELVLYTKIFEIKCKEKEISKQALKWAAHVDKVCENEKGCASDLNYYTALEAATVQFDKIKNRYSDTSKYDFRIEDF